MYRLSCKDHLESWFKHGSGYWCGPLAGFYDDTEHVIEDILRDNERKAEAKKAAAK